VVRAEAFATREVPASAEDKKKRRRMVSGDGAKNEDESEAQAASASVLCTKVAATMQKWLSFSHRLLGILHLVA